MTQVCVFPGHSSVRRSASGLRWPPARAYELCPRISLLRHGQDKAKKLDSAYVNQWQAWYSLQNKSRLNRKGCGTRLEVLAEVCKEKIIRCHISHVHILKKRIGLPSNLQRHSQPRKTCEILAQIHNQEWALSPFEKLTNQTWHRQLPGYFICDWGKLGIKHRILLITNS